VIYEDVTPTFLLVLSSRISSPKIRQKSYYLRIEIDSMCVLLQMAYYLHVLLLLQSFYYIQSFPLFVALFAGKGLTMRISNIIWISLLAIGLICLSGGTSPVCAGDGDVLHYTHLSAPRGPGFGSDCAQCHTSTPENETNVDLDVCDTCHTSGGVFDGIDDPDIGVLHNWENLGSPAAATKSLIYGVGGLEDGKEKWCVGCHDSNSANEVILAVDDFEGYSNDSQLQAVWIGKQDASPPDVYILAPEGSQSATVRVMWTNSTFTYGSLHRDYSPAVDLDNADAIGFWLRTESDWKFEKFKVRIKNNGVWGAANVGFNKFNIEENVWTWIQVPRANFTENTDWSNVETIQIRAIEGTTTIQNVSFQVDDIKFIRTGSISDAPNVVGNNQTWGHYVNGHRIECEYCHDSSSAHIDGQRPSIIYDYFMNTTNPTGFRLYSDPGYGLQLPYTSYVPGPDGAFGLCYQCHDESALMEDAPAEDLNTNFTDEDYAPAVKENLHLEHVGGPGASMIASVYHGHCVMCHDPHGQANPSMARADMGDWLYYDANGCEIPFGADSDSDETMDWHDPDINQGGAQRRARNSGSYPMCTAVCHLTAAPPNPDCAGSNPYTGGTGNNGFTDRSYEYVSHAGTMDLGPICLTAGCHPVGPLHAAHFEPPPGPDFPLDETGCNECHADGRTQCVGYVRFADGMSFADTSVCADALCHPNP
jgi:hypothetical protein